MEFKLLFFVSVFSVHALALDPRIVNGKEAAPGQIPYQVSLQHAGKLKSPEKLHFCGGAIVNEHYVVTAAHCVYNLTPDSFTVIAGSIDLRSPNSIHEVENVKRHENFDSEDSFKNDVALIKVKTPFVRSEFIDFVQLPDPKDIFETGDLAVVSGYGRLSEGIRRTTKLHWANVFIVDQEHCKTAYKRFPVNIYETNICANDPTVRRGSCKGDSGGPVTVNEKLVGIVSWAYGCARKKHPSVLTRVSCYVDWIKQNAI